MDIVNKAIAHVTGFIAGGIARLMPQTTTDSNDRFMEEALKEKERKLREIDLELSKIEKNMKAQKMGLDPPHKDVKHWDSDGKLMDPKAIGGDGSEDLGHTV